MHRERGFAAVSFDDGNNFVFDEFARRLPDEFFLVVQLRIKIDKIHSGILGHFFSLIGTAKSNNSGVAFLGQGSCYKMVIAILLARAKIFRGIHCAVRRESSSEISYQES